MPQRSIVASGKADVRRFNPVCVSLNVQSMKTYCLFFFYSSLGGFYDDFSIQGFYFFFLCVSTSDCTNKDHTYSSGGFLVLDAKAVVMHINSVVRFR
jgi:hypothetical protein